MKVFCYGNQGNVGFLYAQFLRRMGITAQVAFPKQMVNARSLPEWLDPAMSNGYPSWAHPIKENIFSFVRGDRRSRKLAREADVILTSGPHIVGALALGAPVVFHPVGGDITEVPFMNFGTVTQLRSLLYQRRIGHLDCLISAQEDCIWAAKLLRVRRIEFQPLFIDIEQIKANTDKSLLCRLLDKYSSYDWVFLNPSRKNLDPMRHDYKGSELFVDAFRHFVTTYKERKVKAICLLHGNDIDRFKELVKEYGLEDRVDYANHLPVPQLHAYMSLPRAIIFDQFGRPGSNLGGLGREALALGKPVVTRTQPRHEIFRRAYRDNCPVIPAVTTEEIVEAMVTLTNKSPQEIAGIGDRSARWARASLHWESRISEFIALLSDVVKRRRRARPVGTT